MNYSVKRLVDDFVKKIGDDDLRMLQNVQSDVAFNYIYFLYNRFYEAYPTGEVYGILADIFVTKKAA